MKTISNIKVDREVRDQAFEIANDMGVPLNTLTNVFLKKADRDIKDGKNLVIPK